MTISYIYLFFHTDKIRIQIKTKTNSFSKSKRTETYFKIIKDFFSIFSLSIKNDKIMSVISLDIRRLERSFHSKIFISKSEKNKRGSMTLKSIEMTKEMQSKQLV